MRNLLTPGLGLEPGGPPTQASRRRTPSLLGKQRVGLRLRPRLRPSSLLPPSVREDPAHPSAQLRACEELTGGT